MGEGRLLGLMLLLLLGYLPVPAVAVAVAAAAPAAEKIFTGVRGGGGNGRWTSSSPLANSPSRVAAKVADSRVAAEVTEEIFLFSGGGGGNQKGAF